MVDAGANSVVPALPGNDEFMDAHDDTPRGIEAILGAIAKLDSKHDDSKKELKSHTSKEVGELKMLQHVWKQVS